MIPNIEIRTLASELYPGDLVLGIYRDGRMVTAVSSDSPRGTEEMARETVAELMQDERDLRGTADLPYLCATWEDGFELARELGRAVVVELRHNPYLSPARRLDPNGKAFNVF